MLIGQIADLAPADGKFYAWLDVWCGLGAFMKIHEDARSLETFRYRSRTRLNVRRPLQLQI